MNSVIEFEGVAIKPWKDGSYRCPFSSHASGGFGRRKWKTEVGFRKHLSECEHSPSAIKRRNDAAVEARAKELAEIEQYLAAIGKKLGDTVFYWREIITKPTHEARFGRMVRVRYEEEKRFVAESAVLTADTMISLSQICSSLEEAEAKAQERQADWDEHVRFSQFCR